MSTAVHETAHKSADSNAYTATVEKLIDTLPATAALSRAVEQGRQIVEIVAALGLPPDVLAAVRLCPLFRAKLIDENDLQNNNLEGISRLVIELDQLSRFQLPDDWSP
ncbi:MAG: hypothetical protein OER97_09645, partial [Gammaproteobacteria bacterium]|nr:hypothetical protein [Gammaproteobacteria bacterium]